MKPMTEKRTQAEHGTCGYCGSDVEAGTEVTIIHGCPKCKGKMSMQHEIRVQTIDEFVRRLSNLTIVVNYGDVHAVEWVDVYEVAESMKEKGGSV